MNKLLLFFAIIVGFISTQAQDNPFSEYGYTPKIATLSQGQFNESFDNDTIVQIGSVLFNTKSKQIVAFVEYDTLFSEETLEPDIVSRWMSPDPLAAQFSSRSPYEAFASNPVYYIDPDGRAVKAANNDALVLLNAIFETFNTTINGESATGIELFGFSDKKPSDPVFRTSATLDAFEENLSKTSLSKEQQSQAKALFKVLAADDIVEVGLVNQSSTLSTTETNQNNSSNKVSLTTTNSSAKNLLDAYERGLKTNLEIRGDLLNQKTSGVLDGNGAYGFFRNSENFSPVGGTVGLLLINNNSSQSSSDGTMSFGQPTQNNNSFGAARDAILNGITEFSKTKEFKKKIN